MGFFVKFVTLNFGPSSVVFPVYFTSIMRDSPLPLQGSAGVPSPLEPSGQSSRGFGGSTFGGGGGSEATAVALGFAGAGASVGSFEQPKTSGASTRAASVF